MLQNSLVQKVLKAGIFVKQSPTRPKTTYPTHLSWECLVLAVGGAVLAEKRFISRSVAGSKPFRNESGKSRDTHKESASPSFADRTLNEQRESAEQKRS